MTNNSNEAGLWVLGLIVMGIVVVLGVSSGALPWAIAISGLAAVATYLVTREWSWAISWGFASFMGVLLLGAMSLLSPGWYRPLLG